MTSEHDRTINARAKPTQDLLRKTVTRLLLTYVAPFILLTLYFLIQSNNLTKESRRTHLKSLAEHQANILDLYLRERVVNLRNLISDPKLGDIPCPELGDEFLSELKKNSDAFVDIGFFDVSGVQTCYAGPFSSLERHDYSSEPWFVSLRSRPDSHIITDSYLGFRGRPHFTIGVSRIVGGSFKALRATLDPEKIYEYIIAAIGTSDVHISIVNADGYYQIVTPNIGASLEESSVMPPRNPRTGLDQVTIKNKTYDIGYSWLQTAQWALITQLREIEHDGVFAGRQQKIALVSLVIILAGMIVIVFHARTIVHIQEESVETKRQLVHAARLASVGELAAGIAHEINNPLAIISEEAGLVKDLMDPKYGVKYTNQQLVGHLDEIHDAVFRCRDITRKLLAFVRCDGVHPERHNLNDLIGDILDGFLRPEMASSNIDVVRRLEGNLQPVVTDATQFEQVFVNIISNAVDAIGNHPGTITVDTLQDERYVHVAVTDTGGGMDEETLAKIFLPFFTTKDVGKGTGLGLSVSYGIVESMGGTITVESTEGRGSTFTISLPRA